MSVRYTIKVLNMQELNNMLLNLAEEGLFRVGRVTGNPRGEVLSGAGFMSSFSIEPEESC